MGELSQTTSLPPKIRLGKAKQAKSRLAPALAEHEVGATWVKIVSDEEQMRHYVPLWEQLAATASEPNVFFEHWMLLPAIRLLRERADVSIAFVFHQNTHSHKRLIGVMPVESVRWCRHMPLRVMRVWKHRHCYLGTPLVAADALPEFWSAVFDGLEQDGTAGLLELPVMGIDGPVFKQLIDCCLRKAIPLQLEGLYTRAVMEMAPSTEEYAARTPRLHSHRRDYARSERRLSEIGKLELFQLAAEEDAAPRIHAFTLLEAAGWKGHEGTAMACARADCDYLMEVGLAAHSRQALMLVELRLDGKPIAAQINLRSGNVVFGLKTTYDEAHGKNSPGMLLAIDSTDLLHGQTEVKSLDSCAAQGNETMKCIFGELRTIATVLCPTNRPFSRLMASAIPLGRHLHQAWVRLLRLHDDKGRKPQERPIRPSVGARH